MAGRLLSAEKVDHFIAVIEHLTGYSHHVCKVFVVRARYGVCNQLSEMAAHGIHIGNQLF